MLWTVLLSMRRSWARVGWSSDLKAERTKFVPFTLWRLRPQRFVGCPSRRIGLRRRSEERFGRGLPIGSPTEVASDAPDVCPAADTALDGGQGPARDGEERRKSS